MHKLAEHKKKRNLISVLRGAIESRSIQAFVLAASAELVVLQRILDFRLDGLMVVRVADITEVQFGATDKLHKKLLAHEGLLEQVPFTETFNLRSWRSVIDQLSKKFGLVILECEKLKESEFYIGKVLKTTNTGVQFRHFTGPAKWDKKPWSIKMKDITACQAGSNYIDVYQRHFARAGR